MIVIIDKKNKEVIEISGSKRSVFLMNNLNKFNLTVIAEIYSSKSINVNLTSLGFNEMISAAKYCSKYNIKA